MLKPSAIQSQEAKHNPQRSKFARCIAADETRIIAQSGIHIQSRIKTDPDSCICIQSHAFRFGKRDNGSQVVSPRNRCCAGCCIAYLGKVGLRLEISSRYSSGRGRGNGEDKQCS